MWKKSEAVPALSIRQPWAELILHGRKTVELRSWSTDYRGLLWLHTGVKSNDLAETRFGLSDLFKGGYVGSVVLSAVVPLDRKRWSAWRERHLAGVRYQPGQYAWILSSPRAFEHPIPAPGKLYLFYPSQEEEDALRNANLRAPS